ncbi:putative defense protein 3 [Polypterus senegalus]|uniref:putative defense protein 3 n=1 Tax=Polypterus senegalus TaxID=55291 RepID=UPI0019625327|nr:putative defense protein 3 [Polypterus senegalus]
MFRWSLTTGLIVLLYWQMKLASSLPNGAPVSACADLMPRHSGVQPQPFPAPYAIDFKRTSDENVQTFTVVISGPDYKGLLLEALMPNSNIALGKWQTPPPNTKYLMCSGNEQGAITHSNTQIKNNSTTYSWIPPSPMPPAVHFMATVAQSRTVYWLNVKSRVITTVTSSPENTGTICSADNLIIIFIALLLNFLSYI